MNHIAAIVLAAGQSSRLGSPKQLIRFQGSTLVERAVESTIRAHYQPVITVIGAHATQVSAVLEPINTQLVKNNQWESGLGTSIAAGVKHLQQIVPDIDAVLLTLCDQPFLDDEHLQRLRDTFVTERPTIVATEYPDCRCGVPAIFSHDLFPSLSVLSDDRGAQSLIAKCDSVKTVVPTTEPIDIDTIDDVKKLNPFDHLPNE